MEKRSVLITSPSINVVNNISGIANLTKLTMERSSDINYTHFIVGKIDSQKRNVKWLIQQPLIIIRFIIFLIKNTDIRIVHINIPMSKLAIYIDYLLVLVAKMLNRKVVVHFRGGELSLNDNIKWFQKLIIKKCITYSNKVILLGQKEKHYIIDYYSVKDIQKIHVLPNSVIVPDVKKIDLKLSKRDREIINIIYIGRIDKNKGLIELVQALHSVNANLPYQFYFAGVGPYLNNLITLCEELIPRRYTYLGILDNDGKESLFTKSDILLLPSYFEGLPNVLLEAMAYAVIPIVTPVGSIPEVVKDSVNGFLVPVNNYHSIAIKITELYENPSLFKSLGSQAYSTIKSKYSIDSYVNTLSNIYRLL